MAALEILDPGLQATVQDMGRRGLEHLGVPRAGAADPLALAIANLLAGNEVGAAALECTLVGPRVRAGRAFTIGLAGADLGAVVQPRGRHLEPGRSHRLEVGDVLWFTRPGDETRGCRAYLAPAGGIDVAIVLGSRSTSLVGGFGGLDGRAIRAGDVLEIGGVDDATSSPGAAHATSTPGAAQPSRRWPDDLALPSPADPIRVLAGPATDPQALEALLTTPWSVAPASDRRGLRLTTEASVPASVPVALTDTPSHGVMPGSIQLTPSGQPLVLMPDAGTTGGYPVLAVVIDADLGLLGQLVPGAPARFVAVDPAAAVAATAERRQTLIDGAARLAVASDAESWDELWRDARG